MANTIYSIAVNAIAGLFCVAAIVVNWKPKVNRRAIRLLNEWSNGVAEEQKASWAAIEAGLRETGKL